MSMGLRKKVIVYTAVFGSKDNILDPIRYPNVDYVCFTDNDFKSEVWKVILQPSQDSRTFPFLSPRMSARKFKILPHTFLNNYHSSLWIDGNVRLMANPIELINTFLIDSNMACFAHPKRKCIYSEARPASKRLGSEWRHKLAIKTQMRRYKRENYPKNNGLIESSILLRRHMESNVISLMNCWWNEIINGSIRDQLSFNYCSYKQKFKYAIIPGKISKSKYFTRHEHI